MRAMKKLYVGNLAWSSTDNDLFSCFSTVGEVKSARVIFDRSTGRSRGFGFVEMDPLAAVRALQELNGTPLNGRPLRISEANETPR
jgi:RNA recognition motif-containing protein